MPPPLNPVILPRNLTSVLLSWAAPIDVFKCIDRYFITLYNLMDGRGYTFVTDNSTTSQIVSDLTQGLEYAFVVTGVCRDLVGLTSLPSNNLTLDGKGQVANCSPVYRQCIMYNRSKHLKHKSSDVCYNVC